jgi:ribosome maturation factor RimP
MIYVCKDKDFVRSIGEEIEIHLYRAINKQKEFVGILKEFNKEENTFTVELDKLKLNCRYMVFSELMV